jgi:arabinogalactan endo-1,4-beta-galactosidase
MHKWLKLLAVLGMGMITLTGCTEKKNVDNTSEVSESAFTVELPTGPEDSKVYVGAIPDLSDDFIRGMDASSVLGYPATVQG